MGRDIGDICIMYWDIILFIYTHSLAACYAMQVAAVGQTAAAIYSDENLLADIDR